LEERRLLKITVDTLFDVDDAGDGLTTLREAIIASGSGETIDFAPALSSGGPATIQLTNVDHIGELAIGKSLSIEGPGASLLSIKAYDPTPDTKNGDGSRVFNIDDGLSTFQTVSLSGLTLTGGDSPDNGGAIRNFENLDILDCTLSGNAVRSPAMRSWRPFPTAADCTIVTVTSRSLEAQSPVIPAIRSIPAAAGCSVILAASQSLAARSQVIPHCAAAA
jgi:hypothetical protein